MRIAAIHAEQGNWLDAFAMARPEMGKALEAGGIVDETTYLVNEKYLPVKLKRAAGKYRFDFLQGDKKHRDACGLAAIAPPWVQEIATRDLPLAAGQKEILAAFGLLRVGDLAGKEELIRKLPKFGPGARTKLRKAIVDVVENGVAVLRPKPAAASVSKNEAGVVKDDNARTNSANKGINANKGNNVNKGKKPKRRYRSATKDKIAASGEVGQRRPRGRPRMDRGAGMGPAKSLDEGLTMMFGKLSKRQTEVMTMRMGIDRGTPMSGIEVARALGVSRQNVSAVETSALQRFGRHVWLPGFGERIDAMVRDKGLLTPEALRSDPWFASLSPKRVPAVAYLVEKICGKSVDVRSLIGTPTAELEERMVDLKAAAVRRMDGMVGASLDDCRDAVMSIAAKLPKDFRQRLWSEVRKDLVFDRGVEPRLLSPVSTMTAVIRRYLSKSPTPVRWQDVVAELKRALMREFDGKRLMKALEREAIHFGKGRYGLVKHIGLSDRERTVLKEVLEREVRAAYYRTLSMVGAIAVAEREFPGTPMTEGIVEYLLRDSLLVRRTGKGGWKAVAGVDGRRTSLAMATRFVESAGKPIRKQALLAAMSSNGVRVLDIVATFPLFEDADGMVGLVDRDFGYPPQRLADLVRVVEGMLRPGIGMRLEDVLSILAHQGHDEASFELLKAVSTAGARFHVDRERVALRETRRRRSESAPRHAAVELESRMLGRDVIDDIEAEGFVLEDEILRILSGGGSTGRSRD